MVLHRFGTLWVSSTQAVKALLMQKFLLERDWKLVSANLVCMTRVVVSQDIPDHVLRTGYQFVHRAPQLGALCFWVRLLQVFRFASSWLLHRPASGPEGHHTPMVLDCDHPFQRPE